MSIAQGVLNCAETFRKLKNTLGDSQVQGGEEQAYSREFAASINESFERFQLWSSNLGAHRRDKNSLDKRLWEASHLKDRVLEYLKDLQQGITDASAIIHGEKVPWDKLSLSSSSGADDDSEDEDSTELEQLATYISNTINCLLRISMVIQKPAPHDRFLKSGRFDQSFRQPWDEQHVKDKFSNVPDWLTGRLGKAITRRRQFLEYRKTHHERIAKVEPSEVPQYTAGIESRPEDKIPLDARTVGKSTLVSSLPTVVKEGNWHQALASPPGSEPDIESEAGISETSYAETVFGESTSLIPKMPEAAQAGAMFECPYCYMIIGGILTRIQWKRHVFTDLQPYICIHPECTSADETFARRHKWIEHEIHFHSKIWKCNLGCEKTFPAKEDMRTHFTQEHGFSDYTDAHLLAMSVQVQRATTESLACPLCQDQFSSLQRYQKHIARHLEQLALFALPKDSLEDEDMEDDSDNEHEDSQSQISIPSSNRSTKAELSDKVEETKDPTSSPQQEESGSDMEKVYRQTLKENEKKLGLHHAGTQQSFVNLAWVFEGQGRSGEAEYLYRRALGGQKVEEGGQIPAVYLRVMTHLAVLLQKKGRNYEAKQLHQHALVGYNMETTTYLHERLSTLSNLAVLEELTGNHKEAEDLYRKAWMGYMQIPKFTVPVLRNMSNLVGVLKVQNKLKEAEEVCRHVLAKWTSMDEDGNLRRQTMDGYELSSISIKEEKLEARSNLSGVLEAQGKFKEATKLSQQTLEEWEKAFGPAHPSALMSKSNLAHVLTRQGRYSEAEVLYAEVFQARNVLFGMRHADTPKSLVGLICVLIDQKKYDEAEELLSPWEEFFQSYSPWSTDRDGLGEINSVLKRHRETVRQEEWYRYKLEQLQQVEQTHEPNQPSAPSIVKKMQDFFQAWNSKKAPQELKSEDLGERETQSMIDDLEHLYQAYHHLAVKNYAEAAKLLNQALEVQEKFLKKRFKNSNLKTIAALASTWDAEHNLVVAETLYQCAMDECEELLGPKHETTVQIVCNLIEVYRDQGRLTEAEKLGERMLDRFGQQWDASLPALSLADILGDIYSDLGKMPEASKMHEHTVEGYTKILGPSHQSTVHARRNEETQPRPKYQWTCMLYGPRLGLPFLSNSTSCCSFCMVKNPTEEHFLQNHRISECAKRAVEERTFYRPDHLRQHVKNFHGATLFDIVEFTWKRVRGGDVEEEGWTSKTPKTQRGQPAEAEKLDIAAYLPSDDQTSLSLPGDIEDHNNSMAEAREQKTEEDEEASLHMLKDDGENPGPIPPSSRPASPPDIPMNPVEAEKFYRRELEARHRGTDLQGTLKTMLGLGYTLRKQAKYEEAESLYREVIEKAERELGETNEVTLEAMDGLSDLHFMQENDTEAEQLFRLVLERKEKTLGADHDSTHQSVSRLAHMLRYVEKYTEAEILLRQVMEGKMSRSGFNHPDTLAVARSLAGLLEKKGEFNRAEELYRKILEGWEAVLGKENPSTLESVSALAKLLVGQDRVEEGESLYRRAFEGRKKILGINHRDTIDSLNGLAHALQLQKKYVEATLLHQQIVNETEKELGIRHPDTLQRIWRLGFSMALEARYSEIEELYLRVLARFDGEVEEEPSISRRILKLKQGLAHALNCQAKYEDAEEVYHQILQEREKKNVPFDLDTADAITGLTLSIANQGKLDEADLIYQNNLRVFKEYFGVNSSITLKFTLDLGDAYYGQKQISKAQHMFERGIESRLENSEWEDSGMSDMIRRLRGIYIDRGELWLERGEEMFVQILRVYEQKFGLGHLETIETSISLAKIYEEQGKLSEAEQQYLRAAEGERDPTNHADHRSTSAKDELEEFYRKHPEFRKENKSDQSSPN